MSNICNSFFIHPSRRKVPIIFCFYHAGGNARVYQPWLNCQKAEFIPIELPGHGVRSSELLNNNTHMLCKEIAAEIAAELKQFPSREFSVFGHSLGALLAFGITNLLINDYGHIPVCLQVAGRHAPQDEDPSAYRTSMGMNALIDTLRELGQTPEELLQNAEFINFFLPIIFSDYALNENYAYNKELIQVPILAYCGNSDKEANAEHMKRWKQVTNDYYSLKLYDGDHFFLHDPRVNFHEILATDMLSFCFGTKEFIKEELQYERGVI